MYYISKSLLVSRGIAETKKLLFAQEPGKK